LYDLEGNLLTIIIEKLKKAKIYDPNIHFIGVNNFLGFQMSSFHLHILPKKFYKSSPSLKDQIDFNRELRMISAFNISKNLDAYPQYYKGYFQNKYFKLISDLKFNLSI
jgi:hypothetical protein